MLSLDLRGGKTTDGKDGDQLASAGKLPSHIPDFEKQLNPNENNMMLSAGCSLFHGNYLQNVIEIIIVGL